MFLFNFFRRPTKINNYNGGGGEYSEEDATLDHNPHSINNNISDIVGGN